MDHALCRFMASPLSKAYGSPHHIGPECGASGREIGVAISVEPPLQFNRIASRKLDKIVHFQRAAQIHRLRGILAKTGFDFVCAIANEPSLHTHGS